MAVTNYPINPVDLSQLVPKCIHCENIVYDHGLRSEMYCHYCSGYVSYIYAPIND